MIVGREREVGWDTWGDRLIATLAVGAVVSFAAVWVMQYENVAGNPGLIERISYTVVDPTWMPPGVTHPYPLVGLHYFGDLWYHVGYGEAQTPYIIAGRPAQYPPVAIYIFKLWGAFGYGPALVIMSLLNIGLISTFAWMLVGRLAASRKLIVLVFSIVITTPMIVTLDRGGHQYIAVGALAWGLLLYQQHRPRIALALFVVAVSLKPYLAFFLIYPLVRGHARFVVYTALVTLILNTALFFTFPGRATVSFAGFITSTLQFSNAVSFDNIFNGSSLTSLLLHVVELFRGTENATVLFYAFERLLSLPGLLWVALVATLAASRRIPYWASLTLVLSTAAMAIPAAWPYNFASMSVAALYFGLSRCDPFPIRKKANDCLPDRAHATLRISIMLALACTLVPQFGMLTGPSGATLTMYSVVAPLGVLIAGFGTFGVLTYLWVASRRRGATAVRATT